jgi:hypothetical protein
LVSPDAASRVDEADQRLVGMLLIVQAGIVMT